MVGLDFVGTLVIEMTCLKLRTKCVRRLKGQARTSKKERCQSAVSPSLATRRVSALCSTGLHYCELHMLVLAVLLAALGVTQLDICAPRRRQSSLRQSK